jgi:pimeloyl-ACP methyl ester carboxylesterase
MRAHTLLALDSQGFRKIVYREWGPSTGRQTVICAHGLTRNGRDFDFLADALSPRYRVVCPDIAGRGDSDWLHKKDEYGFALYQSDATLLIARVTAPPSRLAASWRKRANDDVSQIDWIGTSMGGLIGMMLAAQAGSPIRRLVLNDVGPLVPWAALMRLKTHVGKAATFRTLMDAEGYIREVCASFGPLTDKQWRHLTIHSVRGDESGGYSLAYDPAISGASAGAEFANLIGPEVMRGVDLWSIWDRIHCPTLVLRGAQSDLLLAETAEEMTRRGPKARVVEFENVGHAPALMSRAQIGVIRNFLDEHD